MGKLNAKQKIFVREYLIDKNGTRAAKAAGYSGLTATAAASRMLTFVNVKEAVEAGLTKQAEKCDITAEKVLNQIASFAFSKSKNVATRDKLKGCELLGKNLKLFVDVQESTVSATVSVANPDEVKAELVKIRKEC